MPWIERTPWLIQAKRPRILMTGSSGRIGTMFTKFSQGQEYDLVGIDRDPPQVEEGLVDFIFGDITDVPTLTKAMDGCDVVAHLAVWGAIDPYTKDFLEGIVPDNVIGTYQVYETAFRLGIPRVVFTSSVQVTEGYPENTPVKTTNRPLPENFYGITKFTGEDLGLVYSAKGVASVNLRLGWLETPDMREEIANAPDEWWEVLSGRDCVEILKRACLNPDIPEGFTLLDAMSQNARKVRELDQLENVLHYQLQDNAFTMFANKQSKQFGWLSQ